MTVQSGREHLVGELKGGTAKQQWAYLQKRYERHRQICEELSDRGILLAIERLVQPPEIMAQLLAGTDLILSGPPGVGKSFAARCLCAEAAMTKPKWSTGSDIVFASTIDLPKNKDDDKLSPLLDAHLLVLDDYGREADNSARVHEMLFRIFDYRYDRNGQTIITTNLSIDKFSERLGVHNIDRIEGPCITLSGASRRQQKIIEPEADLVESYDYLVTEHLVHDDELWAEFIRRVCLAGIWSLFDKNANDYIFVDDVYAEALVSICADLLPDVPVLLHDERWDAWQEQHSESEEF